MSILLTVIMSERIDIPCFNLFHMRDFWAIVMIIVAIRPNISSTTTFTSMIVIGTIVGALIAAVITLENNNLYLRLALLFSFAVMVFATMKVNVILGFVEIMLLIDSVKAF